MNQRKYIAEWAEGKTRECGSLAVAKGVATSKGARAGASGVTVAEYSPDGSMDRLHVRTRCGLGWSEWWEV